MGVVLQKDKDRIWDKLKHLELDRNEPLVDDWSGTDELVESIQELIEEAREEERRKWNPSTRRSNNG